MNAGNDALEHVVDVEDLSNNSSSFLEAFVGKDTVRK